MAYQPNYQPPGHPAGMMPQGASAQQMPNIPGAPPNMGAMMQGIMNNPVMQQVMSDPNTVQMMRQISSDPAMQQLAMQAMSGDPNAMQQLMSSPAMKQAAHQMAAANPAIMQSLQNPNAADQFSRGSEKSLLSEMVPTAGEATKGAAAGVLSYALIRSAFFDAASGYDKLRPGVAKGLQSLDNMPGVRQANGLLEQSGKRLEQFSKGKSWEGLYQRLAGIKNPADTEKAIIQNYVNSLTDKKGNPLLPDSVMKHLKKMNKGSDWDAAFRQIAKETNLVTATQQEAMIKSIVPDALKKELGLGANASMTQLQKAVQTEQKALTTLKAQLDQAGDKATKGMQQAYQQKLARFNQAKGAVNSVQGQLEKVALENIRKGKSPSLDKKAVKALNGIRRRAKGFDMDMFRTLQNNRTQFREQNKALRPIGRFVGNAMRHLKTIFTWDIYTSAAQRFTNNIPGAAAIKNFVGKHLGYGARRWLKGMGAAAFFGGIMGLGFSFKEANNAQPGEKAAAFFEDFAGTQAGYLLGIIAGVPLLNVLLGSKQAPGFLRRMSAFRGIPGLSRLSAGGVFTQLAAGIVLSIPFAMALKKISHTIFGKPSEPAFDVPAAQQGMPPGMLAGMPQMNLQGLQQAVQIPSAPMIPSPQAMQNVQGLQGMQGVTNPMMQAPPQPGMMPVKSATSYVPLQRHPLHLQTLQHTPPAQLTGMQSPAAAPMPMTRPVQTSPAQMQQPGLTEPLPNFSVSPVDIMGSASAPKMTPEQQSALISKIDADFDKLGLPEMDLPKA